MEEYLNKAAALAQTAANLSRRVTENIAERAEDFRLDGQDVLIYDNDSIDMKQIDTMLNSGSDKEKLSGIKRLIAMISKGQDGSPAFAGVVKNVASPNLDIRKLVYIYLLRYAEQEPDLSLLSINTFQKDLSDPNPIIRALALRVLSGIRVKLIAPIVLLAIRNAITDLSPYVRKSASFAIVKLYVLDPSQRESLIDVLKIYLNDTSHIALGGVVMAFNKICPERYDLIHQHFRKLCRVLPDLEEWSQISTIDLLLRYSRVHFLDPNILKEEDNNSNEPKSLQSFYDNNDHSTNSGNLNLDRDHAFLINSVQPLLVSHNSSVVLSAASLLYHIAPHTSLSQLGKPLVRLLRSHQEVQYVVLTNIFTICQSFPKIFEPYLSSFFIRAGDTKLVRSLKLKIATEVVNESTLPSLLRELQAYTKSHDEDTITQSIEAIGRCATKTPASVNKCLRLLMGLMEDKNPAVVNISIIVIKQLLQSLDNEEERKIYLIHLIYAFHKNLSLLAGAKAAILWLVGQYGGLISEYAPDVLRVSIKNFKEEDEIVKRQVLTLAIKLSSLGLIGDKLEGAVIYLLNLARFDSSYDLRDRARFIQPFIVGQKEAEAPNSYHQSKVKVFLSDKKVPGSLLSSNNTNSNNFALGSASLQLNSSVVGYRPLPSWSREIMYSDLRKVDDESLNNYTRQENDNSANSANSIFSPNKKIDKPIDDLNAFYAEDEEETEDDTEGDEDNGSEEESEEDESDDEESSGLDDEDESEEESDEEQEKSTLLRKDYNVI